MRLQVVAQKYCIQPEPERFFMKCRKKPEWLPQADWIQAQKKNRVDETRGITTVEAGDFRSLKTIYTGEPTPIPVIHVGFIHQICE